jgi:hypothetical protein
MVVRNNYARQKSYWGGIPGTIQIHTVPGLGFNNDPTTAVFRDNLPAGFLKCDGTVQNVKDYYLLAQILGIGDESRFKKETTNLRNPDSDTGDLGQFQLPDLGSKVIIGSRGSGEYISTTMENDPSRSKVGVEVDPQSNIGDRANINYIGNMQISGDIANFNGVPKYNLPRDTSAYSLAIDEFQGHYHNVGGDQGFVRLNYTGQHDISGQGKGDDANSANASAGNSLEETSLSTQDPGSTTHDHTIVRPYNYNSTFSYSFPTTNLDISDMTSYVDVDIEDLDLLNQVVTPFILVHYIIKF